MLRLNSCKKLVPTFLKSNFKIFHQRWLKSQVMKIAVIGAAGHVGRPLALSLKQCPLIDELALYDVNETCNFATGLSHIDTKCHVYAYKGNESIGTALNHSKIVVILAAKSKSIGSSYDVMLKSNIPILSDIVNKYAEFSPNALLVICTEPVNSLVPVACEILKKKGIFNPNKVFGISALNGMRANTFAANVLGLDPECVFVPLIGGTFGTTIVPVFSQTFPVSNFTKEEFEVLMQNVMQADEDMLKLKIGMSCNHSCAFALSRFIISLVKGLRCYKNIVECAYVKSKHHCDVEYLMTPLWLGTQGIQRSLGIPRLTEYEICLLERSVGTLAEQIKMGILYSK